MRFIFLGTGTSAGVPVIACDCPTCTSDDPRDVRTRTGACVQWTDATGAERVVLLDTTPDLRAQALRHRLRRCDAILYTHNHVDHVFGLDEVRRFNAVMQAPIDLYADEHTLESLRRVYLHVFDPEHNVNKSFVANLIPRVLEPDRPVDLWGLRFTPIRLLHGRLPILGFRIEKAEKRGEGEAGVKVWRSEGVEVGAAAAGSTPTPSSSSEHSSFDIRHSAPSPPLPIAHSPLPSAPAPGPFLPLAYCTDVSGVPPDSWRHLEGLNTLVLDALRWRHHPTHLTVDQAVEMAARIGAARTWFVHMAHQVKHAETDERLPEGMRLAYDGLTLG